MPILASALAKKGINFTYTAEVSSLNAENLSHFDALMIYANHDSIGNAEEKAMMDDKEKEKALKEKALKEKASEQAEEEVDSAEASEEVLEDAEAPSEVAVAEAMGEEDPAENLRAVATEWVSSVLKHNNS